VQTKITKKYGCSINRKMSDSMIGFSPQPNQIPLFCYLSRKSTSLAHRRITQTPSLVSSIDDYEGETPSVIFY
jgi:hypothetical protein